MMQRSRPPNFRKGLGKSPSKTARRSVSWCCYCFSCTDVSSLINRPLWQSRQKAAKWKVDQEIDDQTTQKVIRMDREQHPDLNEVMAFAT